MDGVVWLLVALSTLVVTVAALLIWRAARSNRLRVHNEPDSVVASPLRTGYRTRPHRLRRSVEIRPLETSRRVAYSEQWWRIEREFVSTPVQALREADTLVTQVMRERGYPVEDYDQRTGVISVDHPGVADNYRVAHEIASAARVSDVSVEDLRRALLHLRSLFDELLPDPAEAPASSSARQ